MRRRDTNECTRIAIARLYFGGWRGYSEKKDGVALFILFPLGEDEIEEESLAYRVRQPPRGVNKINRLRLATTSPPFPFSC
jgi:hypothetical protein